MSKLSRLLPFCGLLSIALLVGAGYALGSIGARDTAPASEWREPLLERGVFAQISGYLHALSGLALAAFVWHLAPVPQAGPAWGRFAGIAWALTFVAGGIVIYAAGDLGGYYVHPDGAKTALVLGHQLYANSIAALLGCAFVLSVGLAPPAVVPRWFARASVWAGGIGAAITLAGTAGAVGLLGMGPLVLWLLTASVVVPWRARVAVARPRGVAAQM